MSDLSFETIKGLKFKDALPYGIAPSFELEYDPKRIIIHQTLLTSDSEDNLLSRLESFEVSKVIDKKEFPNHHENRFFDCFDYAMHSLGLDHYVYPNSDDLCLFEVLRGVSRNFKPLSFPEENCLVVYFNLFNNSRMNGNIHAGVVKSVGYDLLVHSKWSDNHVFSHPINSVQDTYGNHVSFHKLTTNK